MACSEAERSRWSAQLTLLSSQRCDGIEGDKKVSGAEKEEYRTRSTNAPRVADKPLFMMKIVQWYTAHLLNDPKP